MSLTRFEMDRRLDEHFHFEANDDVEGVLSTLTDNAVHDIVGTPTGPTRGREGARRFYETMYRDLAESRVTSLRRLYGENFVIDESIWEGIAPGRPFGLEGRGRPLRFRMLHVVEFDELAGMEGSAGGMKREQVWVDLAAIIQQLPQH